MLLGCSANSSIVRSMSAIVFMGVALVEGLMSAGEIGTLCLLSLPFRPSRSFAPGRPATAADQSGDDVDVQKVVAQAPSPPDPVVLKRSEWAS